MTANFARVTGFVRETRVNETLIGENLWHQFHQREMEGRDRLQQAWRRVMQTGAPQILVTYLVAYDVQNPRPSTQIQRRAHAGQ